MKSRFDRSAPTVLRADDLLRMKRNMGSHRVGRLVHNTKTTQWRPISIETLGYLAAKNKVGIIQVHQRLGDRPNRKFTKAFLAHINLNRPSEQEMKQLSLYSHLLFP